MSVPGNHTVTAFDEDLAFLTQSIADMGGHAERMLARAVEALDTGDMELAASVIADDKWLDRAEREVDEKAVLIIARRQPMAQDLREIVGSIRIAADLERVGDLGKNIAKRVAAVQEFTQPRQLMHGIEHLSQLARNQLAAVLDAYATRSIDTLDDVRDRDEEIDAMHTSLFREMLTYMMEDPRTISSCTHLLFCAKNIERIGDHTTNIAEHVHMMVCGELPDGDRPKSDRSSLTVVKSLPANAETTEEKTET